MYSSLTVADAVEVQPFAPVSRNAVRACRQVAQIFRHRTVRPQIRVGRAPARKPSYQSRRSEDVQDVLGVTAADKENGVVFVVTVADAVEVQPFCKGSRQVAQIFRHRTVRPQIRVGARHGNRHINRAVRGRAGRIWCNRSRQGKRSCIRRNRRRCRGGTAACIRSRQRISPCRQVAQIFRHRTVRPQIRVRARHGNRHINRAVRGRAGRIRRHCSGQGKWSCIRRNRRRCR